MIDSQFYLLIVYHDSVGPFIRPHLRKSLQDRLTRVMTIKSRSVSPHRVPTWPRIPDAKGAMFSAEPSLPCVAIYHQPCHTIHPGVKVTAKSGREERRGDRREEMKRTKPTMGLLLPLISSKPYTCTSKPTIEISVRENE